MLSSCSSPLSRSLYLLGIAMSTLSLSAWASGTAASGTAGSKSTDSKTADSQTSGEDESMSGDPVAGVTAQTFGQLPDGREVELYHLINANGLEMSVMSYGGTIVSLKVPDAQGNSEDVVLGFDNLEDYLSPAYRSANPYFGAIIGRYGNRIAGGQFEIDGTEYQVPTNDGDNSLHGGDKGFDQRLWEVSPVDAEDGVGVVLSLVSEDGDQGYPGQLETQVRYTLTNDNALDIRYQATTTETTPINLTQHSYFNLEGEGGVEGQSDILDHLLTLNADAFTPVDEGLIPTGEIRSVEGTAFDFREPTPVGARIDGDDQQLQRGKGYDHNFVLAEEGSDAKNGSNAEGLVLAARVEAPQSGRIMEVYTTEPGVQFYSGNFLDGTLVGKAGKPYEHRSGLALETQHFPDSPNQSEFPSTLLSAGETYKSHTRYEFSTR